jgi:hypothetical protein
MSNKRNHLLIASAVGVGLLSVGLTTHSASNISGFHKPAIYGTTVNSDGYFAIVVPSGDTQTDSVMLIEAALGTAANTWDYATSANTLDDIAVGGWSSTVTGLDSAGNVYTARNITATGVADSLYLADKVHLSSALKMGSAGVLSASYHSLSLVSTSAENAEVFAFGSKFASMQFNQQQRAATRGTGSTLYCDITFDVDISEGKMTYDVLTARPANWQTTEWTKYDDLGTVSLTAASATVTTDIVVIYTGPIISSSQSIHSDIWNGASESTLSDNRASTYPTNDTYTNDAKIISAFNACSAFHSSKEERSTGGLVRIW